MMLAAAEVIVVRAQLPAKGSNIVSLKNCQIQFVGDRYLPHAFWELWSFATKNVGFENRMEGKLKNNFNKGNASQEHDFKTNHKKIYCRGLINVIPLKEGVY